MASTGDVVLLKSGGPFMTIKELIDDDKVLCFWFDNEHKIHEAVFPRDTIRSRDSLPRNAAGSDGEEYGGLSW